MKQTDYLSTCECVRKLARLPVHYIKHTTLCELFLQVYNVRNKLCHKKLADNLQLKQTERDGFFRHIYNLVDCLERMHPTCLSSVKAKSVRDSLKKVSIKQPYTCTLHHTTLVHTRLNPSDFHRQVKRDSQIFTAKA